MFKRIKDLKTILSREFRLLDFQRSWRSMNAHNYTIAGRIFPANIVSVGTYSYGTLNILSYGNSEERLKIGNYCSIAGGTTFILSGEHNYKRISTFPFSKVILGGKPESICKGPIIINDDVWIGYGCIILSGVTIGKGAVIGAGSIVYKDVPEYAIYAGNKVVKYRFPESTMKRIKNSNLPLMDENQIKNNLKLLELDIDEENLETVLTRLGSL
ncbi:Acetyltransferase (isoleucine patch superfamily) [Ruminococcaceae bacterium FB2012]|nr:Acetyltransferase (isoleucine patch superfamily) [Ruminococcaceae bacterium FB2012]